MQKEKIRQNQKGITLIALIITIIVMLILVGVSVTVALKGGLFSSAQDATAKTEIEKQKEEQLSTGRVKVGEKWYDSLEDYANGILSEDQSDSTGGTVATAKWVQEGNTLKYIDASGQETNISVNIGDKVDYDETDGTPLPYETDANKGTGINYDYELGELVAGKYTIDGSEEGETEAGDLEWRVLGVNEEGQLELISITPTVNALWLYGRLGYQNLLTKNGVLGTLDTFCNNLYGQGAGAESARSLTAEDINKLGNYDPSTEFEGYGTEYTYMYDTTAETVKCILTSEYETYKDDMTNNWTDTYRSTFYLPNYIIDSDNIGPETLKNTYYEYIISDYIDMTISDELSMTDVITKDENNDNFSYQLLASLGSNCEYTYATSLSYLIMDGRCVWFGFCYRKLGRRI